MPQEGVNAKEGARMRKKTLETGERATKTMRRQRIPATAIR
jgi:hypothetical protein